MGRNGKKRRHHAPNETSALTRAARNAAFAAVLALDAHAAESKGDRKKANLRATSVKEWLLESQRETRAWLDSVGL